MLLEDGGEICQQCWEGCGAGVGNIRLGEMLDIYLSHVTFVFWISTTPSFSALLTEESENILLFM